MCIKIKNAIGYKNRNNYAHFFYMQLRRVLTSKFSRTSLNNMLHLTPFPYRVLGTCPDEDRISPRELHLLVSQYIL